jgi:hypothetical protein
MSNIELENYLALISRLLRLSRSDREAIGSELRDHLESRVAELTESGVQANDATRIALEEFGDAVALASKLQSISFSNRRRWMMRFTTFSVAGCFIVAVLLMAAWPDRARFGAPNRTVAQSEDSINDASASSASTVVVESVISFDSRYQSETSKSNKYVEQKLAETTSLSFDEQPFSDVMKQLLEMLGINVILDANAVDDSLTPDTSISFNAKDLPLKHLLRFMLRPHNATYSIDHGVLRIISLDSATDPEFFRRKMFDCRNLVNLISVNSVELGSQKRSNLVGGFGGGGGGVGGGGVGGGGVFAVGATDEIDPSAGNRTETSSAQDAVHVEKDSPPTPASKLIDLVKFSIEPDGWSDAVGDATISFVSGILVVAAPEATLEDIDDFLKDLNFELSRTSND